MTQDSTQAVVDAANEAVPKVAGTSDMAGTVQFAKNWLVEHHFNQIQVDRWDHDNGISIEMGFVHGEVWWKVWFRVEKEQWPIEKLRAFTVHPDDLEPLFRVIRLLGQNPETL